MSKKSYKRNQNRLYREIKRRILAENMLYKPFPTLTVTTRPIETLKIKSLVPNYIMQHEEIVKQDMANKITHKLIADGFIVFHSREYCKDFGIQDTTEVEAILNVIRPVDI